MYYPRHAEEVVQRLAKRKSVVVLTGARHVGKLTMLRALLPSVTSVMMNHPLVRLSAIENPSLFFDLYKPPVVVDEIQKVPELFEYIKDIVDEKADKGQFYCTGSQNFTLMSGVSESLAGRAGIIRLLGLSLREIVQSTYRIPFLPTAGHAEAVSASMEPLGYDDIVRLIHTGFFPELHQSEGDLDDWQDFYSSYFQTYIEKDVKDVLRIQDESAFIKFVRATAACTGNILNMSSIAEVCGKDVKTVQAWLSVLESSGLVYLLQPYHNNFNKRLAKTPKLHFLDTGLACWLLGWNTPEQLVHGAMWGHIFESFVFGEVLKSYYNNGIVVPPLYYYRDRERSEIDLVIEQGDTLHPVEIKTTSDPTSSMVSSFRCLDDIGGKKRGEGAVVCLAKEYLPLRDDVWIMPAQMV